MNPYKVLGVSENASQEEIRKAYLALVKKYHPDRYADGPMKDMANEKLKEINQAYEKPCGARRSCFWITRSWTRPRCPWSSWGCTWTLATPLP